ncbi:MAG TPA: histidine kinase [Chloroflexota bacterium]|jgi:signal transduction histidine kinase
MPTQNGVPDPQGASGVPPPAPPGSVGELCEHLAQSLHDGVLQSLALAMLEADLCRRAIEAGDQDTALAELRTIEPELQSVITALRTVIRDLHLAAHAARPPA